MFDADMSDAEARDRGAGGLQGLDVIVDWSGDRAGLHEHLSDGCYPATFALAEIRPYAFGTAGLPLYLLRFSAQGGGTDVEADVPLLLEMLGRRLVWHEARKRVPAGAGLALPHGVAAGDWTLRPSPSMETAP